MRVGLFFGSFNPIHVGHLMLAQALANSQRVDVVWLVISPQNPHKDKATLAPQHDRLRMVELAIADNPALQPSNVEFLLPQPSYTIHTLDHLATRYPSYRFQLLMGEDNLRSLPKWKDWERILSGYTLNVYPRLDAPGTTPDDPWTPPTEADIHRADIHRLDAPFVQLSASRIRAMLGTGQDCRYLLPDAVIAYIRQQGLYNAR